MTQILFCAIILNFLVIQQTFGRTFTCKGNLTTDCIVNNAHLTSSKKDFKLLLLEKNKNQVIWFQIKNSTVEILTNYVCETLPHIREFRATRLDLAAIEVNAFENCLEVKLLKVNDNRLESLPVGVFDHNVNLTRVHLNNNKLKTLDENLFQNNRKLEEIWLNNNLLKSVPMSLFNSTPNLNELFLSNNQLTDFSFVNEMSALEALSLERNKLSDLGMIELLLDKCPNLWFIWVGGNEFTCDKKGKRLIVKALIAKKIRVDNFGHCVIRQAPSNKL